LALLSHLFDAMNPWRSRPQQHDVGLKRLPQPRPPMRPRADSNPL
jgi:hypothetical protein